MNESYDDIRSRIPEEPAWFDEHAVPRYCEFHPHSLAKIYADACALVLIECQNCKRSFRVAMSWMEISDPLGNGPVPSISELHEIHYGDPPNVRCCPSGPTMNCLDIQILEWWDHQNSWDQDGAVWKRNSEKEIFLPDSKEWLGTHCSDCDPSFGCFDGSRPCCKRPL